MQSHSEKKPLVLFSTQAWSEFWVSKHWIAYELSKERLVVFVEPPARASFGRLILGNRRSGRLKKISDRLFVLKLESLPFIYRIPSLFRPFWRIFLNVQLKQAIAELKLKKFDVLAFDPHCYPLLRSLKDNIARIVYYAVDPPLGNEDVFWPERRIVFDSDAVIAVTERLAKILSRESGRADVQVIPHGINFQQSSDLSGCKGILPDCFNALRVNAPVIGYTGSIHEIYVDSDLLRYAALKRPEYEFVLVGPYSGSALDKKGFNVDGFSEMKNVHFCGALPFKMLKCAISGFDVCIIPYRSDLENNWERRSPFKVLHYLAQGKPIVISNVPASEDYEGFVRVYDSKEGFLLAIDDSLSDSSEQSKTARRSFAEARSFEHLIKLISDNF